MAEWIQVCRIEEVADGRPRIVEAAGARLAVVRDGETVVVFPDRCPHAGGSLGLGRVEESELICPLHRWRFRVKDGRCTTVRGHDAHQYLARTDESAVWAWL